MILSTNYAKKTVKNQELLHIKPEFSVDVTGFPNYISAGEDTSLKLSLLENGNIVKNNVQWIVQDDSDECLNASVFGDTLTINPTDEAASGNISTLKLSAYCFGNWIANLSYQFTDIIHSGNMIVYFGKAYELPNNLSPNYFCELYYKAKLLVEDPENYKNNVYLGGSFDAASGISYIRFNSPDLTVTKINPYFLTFCTGLKELDIGALTTIDTIRFSFLDNCTSLSKVIMPRKAASTIYIENDGLYYFMDELPKTTILDCGSGGYLKNYRLTFPWSQFSRQMVGDHFYEVEQVRWNIDLWGAMLSNNEYSTKLRLLDAGYEEDEDSYHLEINSANECLNASIENNVLKIKPTEEAADKRNVITINAYKCIDGKVTDELITCDTICLNNIYGVHTNFMCYDNKTYVLADNINPNLFSTYDFGERKIPLKNGLSVTINKGYKNWGKLACLSLSSCDPNVTTIGANFLEYCISLRSLRLNGLTSINKIDAHFLDYCKQLSILYLPETSPEYWSVDDTRFMYGIPTTTHFVCGDYVSSYVNTYPWCLRAHQFVHQ